IESFAGQRSIPVTLFAIGADLARAESAARLRTLVDRGHGVENHSLSHRYDLVRLGREAIAAEVEGGARAIEAAIGRAPRGFRAPGYTVTDEVLDVLEELGVAFDSSVFPCPLYYGAKAAMLGALRMLGRSSASVLDTPRVVTAPTRPYRPGRPWHRRGRRAMIELPIQVTPILRLPMIGTSLALAGPPPARLLGRACRREPFVNIELHGIDFLDASDGLSALMGHQAELSVPLARRLEAVEAALDVFVREGFSFVRLDEAAAAVHTD